MSEAQKYKPTKTLTGVAQDTGLLGSVGVLLGLYLPGLREHFPWLIMWESDHDLVALGAIMSLLAGANRGVRSLWNHLIWPWLRVKMGLVDDE